MTLNGVMAVILRFSLNLVNMCSNQGRRHSFESGGTNSASGASRKFFLTPPLFGQWRGQNIAYVAKSVIV